MNIAIDKNSQNYFIDNAPGILREDRYIDTGNLDDYYIQVTCRDRPVITDETKKTYECSNYVIIVMIRKVPPSQFPWTQALDDMKKFAPIEDKEIFFYYLGDGMSKHSYYRSIY